MHITAHLDLDLIALDEENQVTCLLELTAPADERVAERPARTLVVVLDRSGSMSGEPLEAARTSIESLARRLGQRDCFGLVVFDSGAQVAIPVRPMADHDLDALIHTVRGLRPGGSTNLSGGYLLALREVKASLAATGHTSATLLLLSDGHANAGEVDYLRRRVGDGFNKNGARVGLKCSGDIGDISGIDESSVDAEGCQRAKEAVCVAEQEGAGDNVIPLAQQRQRSGRDSGHACAEAHGGNAVFHAADLAAECFHGRVALAAVGVAAFLALEHGGNFTCVFVTEGHRGVDGLVQHAVLGPFAAVRVQGCGGEVLLCHGRKSSQKPEFRA